jgi:hypothetical protein
MSIVSNWNTSSTSRVWRFDIYGDYDLGPLTNDSERMIAVARRTEG